MKPIQPGCLVVVFGHPEHSNNGKSCTAVRFVGLAKDEFGRSGVATDYWELDIKIITELHHPETHASTGLFQKVSYCSERFLLRVDGFEEKNFSKVELAA